MFVSTLRTFTATVLLLSVPNVYAFTASNQNKFIGRPLLSQGIRYDTTILLVVCILVSLEFSSDLLVLQTALWNDSVHRLDHQSHVWK